MTPFFKEEIDWTWSERDIRIFFKLDGRNRIYTYKFECPEKLLALFELCRPLLLDKPLDELKTNFVAKASSLSGPVKNFEFYQVIYQIRQALQVLSGHEFVPFVDARQIVCRCAGKDKSLIRAGHLAHKGNLRGYVRETAVSMGCGECRSSLKSYWQELNNFALFIQGKTIEEFESFLENALSDFLNYTHLELEVGDIELKSFDNTNLRFETNSSLPKEKILANLENFYCGNKQLPMKVYLDVLTREQA